MNRQGRWGELVRHALQTVAFVGAALVLAAVVYSSVVVQNRRAEEASETATVVAEAKETAAAVEAENAFVRPKVGVVGARDHVRLYMPSDPEGVFPGPSGAILLIPGQGERCEVCGRTGKTLQACYFALWHSGGPLTITHTSP